MWICWVNLRVNWFSARDFLEPFNRERIVFSTNGTRTVEYPHAKNEFGPFHKQFIKINSKWTKDLNVRAKSINFLKENIGVNLHDVGLGNDFLDMSPKKEILDKLDFTEIKKFCASKDTIKRVNRPAPEWEKIPIFANHRSYDALVSSIYKELLQLNNKKINNPVQKWARTWIDISPKNINKWPIST